MVRNIPIAVRIGTIIFGLIFLTVGLLFFFTFDPDAYDIETTGTISGIEEYWDHSGEDPQLSHRVYITYAADGVTYSDVEYGAYKSSMKVGDEVTLYYMSADPTQITTPGKDNVPLIGLLCAVIGAVDIIINVVILVKRRM